MTAARRCGVLAALTLLAGLAAPACGSPPVAPLPFDAPVITSAPTTASPSATPSASVATNRPPRRTTPPPGTPACLGAVVYRIPATTEVAPKSICVATGAVLRVEDTGPGTVFLDPPESVSCFYEAGIVECRFLTAGTVMVRIDRDPRDDIEFAVVVK